MIRAAVADADQHQDWHGRVNNVCLPRAGRIGPVGQFEGDRV